MNQPLTLFFCFFLAFSGLSQPNSTTGGHFVNGNVDTIPKYESGEFGFADYLTRHFRVSQSIKREGVDRTYGVIVSFDVDTLGVTSNVSVQNAENPYIAQEFRRICQGISGWTPAYLYGSKVKTRIYVPFTFMVKEDHIFHDPAGNLLVVRPKNKKATMLKIILGSIVLVPVIVGVIHLVRGNINSKK